VSVIPVSVIPIVAIPTAVILAAGIPTAAIPVPVTSIAVIPIVGIPTAVVPITWIDTMESGGRHGATTGMRAGEKSPGGPRDELAALILEKDVKAALYRLSRPMVVAFLSITAFNLADTFYVGQLGTDELAAMTFTFPVAMLFIGLATGIGMGASSVVSRAVGSGDIHGTKTVTTHVILLTALLSTVLSIVGILTIDPLFSAMGAGPDILPLVRDYMVVWYVGTIFIIAPMTGNSVIRALGDTKTPMKIMMTAAALNIVLDPLLIFGPGPLPRMELAGAAWATVGTRAITMLLSLWILHHREHLLVFRVPSLPEVMQSWKSVLHIGAPSAATNMLFPVVMGALTHIAAGLGNETVAALGVGTRIEFLAILPAMSLAVAAMPLVGQNFGAGNRRRVYETVRAGCGTSFAWGLGVAVLLAAVAPVVSSAFRVDEDVREILILYLRIVPWSYAFLGISLQANSIFNTLGRPFPAAVLVMARFFGLILPLAFAGAWLYDEMGLFLGIMLANILGGIVSFIWLDRSVLGPFGKKEAGDASIDDGATES